MVWVDFSDARSQKIFREWFCGHCERLSNVSGQLSGWARASAAAEKTEKPGSQRPLAVVFDIDEVLLCNIHHNGWGEFRVADFFPERDAGGLRDPPYPGARALLAEASRLGLAVFYVTGRLEPLRADTIADFVRARFYGDDSVLGEPATLTSKDGPLYMCPAEPGFGESVSTFKTAARARIEETHRIVANIGDQPSDLGSHGDRQILLPNPFYHTA